MKRIFAFTFIFLLPLEAHAYIDPGTGSAIVYVIIGLVASALYFLKGIFYRILDLVSSRSTRRHVEHNIAIHSEGKQYDLVFLPIMRHLSELGLDYTYFTMYERDDTCEPLPDDASHVSIAPGLIGYSFLNKLRAKLLITTTPQLNIMTFKRSKHVKHYTYVQHGIGEAMYLRPFPYDYFDSVMCCGKLLVENIREIEVIRKQEPKQLFETGIPYFDDLLKRKVDIPKRGVMKTILIAPSWGELSLFSQYGTQFVETLVHKFEIIVRPHPQMKFSQTELYERVIGIEGVEIDTNETFEDSMARADVLVSDFSGIIHECAFIYEKPVIVAEYQKNMEPFEGFVLNKPSTLAARSSEFIVSLPVEEFGELDNRIDEIIARFSKESVRRVRDELLFNFGHAGRAVATQVAEIVRCL